MSSQAVRSIRKLLNDAKLFIPQTYWKQTKAELRATAGLRALEAEKSQTILDGLNTLFENSEFNTNNDKPVGLLDGSDEGVYSWFTVNYLQKRLDDTLDNTSAVIELGGGSAQVSYIPTSKNSSEEFIQNYNVMGKSIRLYTKCFEKMGLMSGRQGTYTKQDSGEFHYTSPCLHKDAINVEYDFGPDTFYVSGEENNHGIDFEKCKETIMSYITSSNVEPPEDLINQKIATISFFFDLAKDAGLIEEQQGEITLNSYYEAASIECKNEYKQSDAFKCLDLLYIAVFLEKGLGIKQCTKMNLVKSVDGHGISWTLGAAYSLLKPEQKTLLDENDTNITINNVPNLNIVL